MHAASSTTTKPSSRLCIAPLRQTLVQTDLRSGLHEIDDSRQTYGARHRYLLPVAASIFINAAEADSQRQIFVVFTGQLAGFATGAAAGDNKKSLGCHRLLLHLFNLNKVYVTDGFPLARDGR